MDVKTRTRRTVEERVAEIDQKIAYHQELIDGLNKRKQELLVPREPQKRKTSMRQAIEAIKEAGLSPDEVMKLIAKHSSKK